MGLATLQGFLFPTLISLLYLLSFKMRSRGLEHKQKFISFSAGFLASFVFIFLLPELYAIKSWKYYALALAGFSFFHVTEKLFYKHIIKRKIYLARTHFIVNFLHQFVIGAFIYILSSENLAKGMYLFIPLYGVVLVGSLSIENLHRKQENKVEVFIISISALLGAMFTAMTNSLIVTNILVSLVVGSLVYIVMRELIPFKKDGNPGYFLLGNLAFLVMNILIG